MLLRSESPSPVDEYDPDSRVKRQRHATLTLEHTGLKKRKLPSRPQSPTEEEDAGDARSLIAKRQRCMALEHGIERLSLTPPSRPAPEFAARLPAAVPDFGFSSSNPRWVELAPGFQQTGPPPFATSTAPPVLPASAAVGADAIEDVKMRSSLSSSWYEPEKDRIVVTDLDASDEEEDGDGVDGDAPKLPRAVLQALLRGDDVPRMLRAGLLPSSSSPPLPAPPPPLELANFFPEPGSSDEAMDIEQ